MANSEQIDALVERLYDKTRQNTVRWDSTIGQHRYQTRFGDFIIMLQSDTNALSTSDFVQLDVKRLSGAVVASISTSPFSMIGRRTQASAETQQNLVNLFNLVDNKSDEISELLDLIG